MDLRQTQRLREHNISAQARRIIRFDPPQRPLPVLARLTEGDDRDSSDRQRDS